MPGETVAFAPEHGNSRLGAVPLPEGGSRFLVWAPKAARVDLHVVQPEVRLIPLHGSGDGYYSGVVERLGPGARYFFRIEGEDLPDPASRFQPAGVHGPSEVASFDFPWTDSGWQGIPLKKYVFYELHTGTFTPDGTLDAIVPRLDYLAGLGVTAIEIMPVAQFPGVRNWGYDGVYPFSVQNSYGGPAALARLVDAAHGRGLAVVLDVVYNHLGPEGNYLGRFGPYFTDRYQTPWGEAINFDGFDSGPVRRYFIENALQWVRDFHIDALRLDAVHGIFDSSPRHILQELAEAVHEEAARLGRHIHLVAESDLNEPRLVRPVSQDGYGLDAQWADDLHHALHTLLTGESDGYYADFGRCEHLAAAYRSGYTYTGQFSPYRQKAHGKPPERIQKYRFVVCSQNHDQVGNRMLGERLSTLVSYEGLKVAAGAVLLSPFLPLLFMGEEYGETAPFQYFADHSDPHLIEAVRTGRQAEFAAFRWKGEVPDAHEAGTFERSRPNPALVDDLKHACLLEFYKEMLRVRPGLPEARGPVAATAFESERAVAVRWEDCLLFLHFGKEAGTVEVAAPEGRWRRVVDSASREWLGPGSPAPETVRSAGRIRLTAAPTSCCLFRLGA